MIFIAGMVMYVLVIGSIANWLGVNTSGVERVIAPGESPGFLGILSFIWEAVQTFFEMMLFQVEGVPEVVNLVLAFPPIIFFVFAIKTIRGTG